MCFKAPYGVYITLEREERDSLGLRKGVEAGLCRPGQRVCLVFLPMVLYEAICAASTTRLVTAHPENDRHAGSMRQQLPST